MTASSESNTALNDCGSQEEHPNLLCRKKERTSGPQLVLSCCFIPLVFLMSEIPRVSARVVILGCFLMSSPQGS